MLGGQTGILGFMLQDNAMLSSDIVYFVNIYILSQPKFNQQLCSTEFEVRLHSYTIIHHPTESQLEYSKLDRADNCPAS